MSEQETTKAEMARKNLEHVIQLRLKAITHWRDRGREVFTEKYSPEAASEMMAVLAGAIARMEGQRTVKDAEGKDIPLGEYLITQEGPYMHALVYNAFLAGIGLALAEKLGRKKHAPR